MHQKLIKRKEGEKLMSPLGSSHFTSKNKSLNGGGNGVFTLDTPWTHNIHKRMGGGDFYFFFLVKGREIVKEKYISLTVYVFSKIRVSRSTNRPSFSLKCCKSFFFYSSLQLLKIYADKQAILYTLHRTPFHLR